MNDVGMQLDPDIAALVAAMNESSLIQTIGSCQGHPRRFCDPYVYFSTSSATAARIAVALRKWGRGPSKCLAVEWQLIGHFDAEGELRFRLQAPQYCEISRSYVGSFVQFYCKKLQVRSDLTKLADLMHQTLSDIAGRSAAKG